MLWKCRLELWVLPYRLSKIFLSKKKKGFCPNFSCCPKILSCPKFAQPPRLVRLCQPHFDYWWLWQRPFCEITAKVTKSRAARIVTFSSYETRSAHLLPIRCLGLEKVKPSAVCRCTKLYIHQCQPTWTLNLYIEVRLQLLVIIYEIRKWV